MSSLLTHQAPLKLGSAAKRDPRIQCAALCYRVKKSGAVEVLLVSSRETERWIVPKGWPMNGKTPAEAAAVEAWEEAGVKGKVIDLCIGLYSYNKALDDGSALACVVTVFPIRVKSLEDVFPEAGTRKRKWFKPAKAAKKVREKSLKRLLENFDPSGFHKTK